MAARLIGVVLRRSFGGWVGAPAPRLVASTRRAWQPHYQYRVRGTVTILATGASVPYPRVRLYDRMAFTQAVQMRGGQDGSYAFEHLPNLRYFAIAFDDGGDYNAVVADDVMPEPMP